MELCNEQYEKTLLGIMLLDNSLIDIIAGRLSVECFYTPKARQIYYEIIEEWKADKCANLLTLTTKFPDDRNYIMELSAITASSADWEFYVTKIKDFYLTRTFKNELLETVNKIKPESINTSISNLQTKLSSFLQYGGNGAELKNLCQTVPDEIQKAYIEKKKYLGYESGFEQLDDILDGWQTSYMYAIGARTSIGKTAFVLTLLRKLCMHGVSATLFSLEMSAKQDFYRMLAAESSLPMWQLKKGTCMEYKTGVNKVMSGLKRLFDYDLNIIDQGANKEEELYSRIRYEAVVKGKKLFVIDHLGLIQSSNPTSNHYLDVGRITSTLHAMAKELDVCIVILVQMNREAEGKKPTLAQIRESGNIEQDTDVIMFLYRERDLEEDKIPTQIIVEKNRDGKTGYADFIFDKPTQNFIQDRGDRDEEIVVPVKEKTEVAYEENELPF